MKLLETLVKTPSVAGREHRIRQAILKHSQGLWDHTQVDALGSLICTRKPRPKSKSRPASPRGKVGKSKKASTKPLRVMIAAHMDQIGFVVRHIEPKGFLRLQNVGGFDTRNLFSRLVTVCTDPANSKGDLPGVLNPSGKPLHVASEEEKKKIPTVAELVVDLGLPAEQVHKKVKIGDMVVLDAPFRQIGNTVVSQCLDNRVACWLALRAMQKLKHHDCEIVVVFTVQEEVGCRGAGPAACFVKPDVAIALDTTLCIDTPGVPEEQRVTQQGQGVGLMVMDSSAITDLQLLETFETIARKKKIKAQRTILARGGTDAATIQRKATGFRVMTLVCPTRYIHTTTEMIHKTDLQASLDLLVSYLAQAS